MGVGWLSGLAFAGNLLTTAHCAGVADFIRQGVAATPTQKIAIDNSTVSSSTTTAVVTISPVSNATASGNSTSFPGTAPSGSTVLTVITEDLGSTTVYSTAYACSSGGIVEASACSSSWTSWSSASASFLDQHKSTYTTTTVLPPYTNFNGPYSILGTPDGNQTGPYATCNGIPRYSGGWTATGSVSTDVGPSQTVEYIGTKTLSTYPHAQPTCCIGVKDCYSLQEEWHVNNPLVYPFNESAIDSGWYNGIAPASYPHCNSTNQAFEGGYGDCSGCWLGGENAKILYWPQEVEPAPSCPLEYVLAPSNTTTPANYTATAIVTLTNEFSPNTTTTYTLTSPTVYMSVQALQGRDACHGFYGILGGAVFPMGPNELSTAILSFPGMTDAAASSSFASIIAHQETSKYTDLFGVGWQTSLTDNPLNYPLVTQTVPMNLADLGRPPPFLSYYLGLVGDYCLVGDGANVFPQGMPCDTMFDAYNSPQVKIGSAAKSLMPNMWSTCQLDFGWDPPIALTAVNAAASLTLPSPKATPTPPTASSVPSLPQITSIALLPPSSPESPIAPPTNSPASPSSAPPQSVKPPVSQTINSNQEQNPQPSSVQLPNNASPPAQDTTPAAIITVGSSTFNVQQGQPATIGDQTISVGGAPVTIGTQVVSLGSSGVAVDSNSATFSAPAASAAPAVSAAPAAPAQAPDNSPEAQITVGDSTINIKQNQPVTIAGQTLTVGGAPATIDGHVVSIGSSGVAVDGSTAAFALADPTPAQFVAGASTFSALRSGSVIELLGSNGAPVATLTAGGSAATIGGQVISAASSGLQVGSSVLPVPGVSGNNAATTTAVINGHTITAAQFSGGSFAVVDGLTLTRGGAASTVDGQVVSFGTNGLVVSGTNGVGTTLALPRPSDATTSGQSSSSSAQTSSSSGQSSSTAVTSAPSAAQTSPKKSIGSRVDASIGLAIALLASVFFF